MDSSICTFAGTSFTAEEEESARPLAERARQCEFETIFSE